MRGQDDARGDERGLLAGLIYEPHRIGKVAITITPNDFDDAAHGELFGLLVDLQESGANVRDTHMINEHAKRCGLVERLGGTARFSRDFISGMAGTPWNVPHYMNAVRRRSVNRRITELAERLRDDRLPPEERLDFIEGQIAAIRSQLQAGSTESTIGQIHSDLLRDIETTMSSGRMPTMQTGIRAIDETYGGLLPDTLTVLAARPSIGKSTLGFQIARNVAESAAGNVRFVSLEMSREELGARDMAARTGINSKAIGTHSVSRFQLEEMREVVARLGITPLTIDAPFGRAATIEAIAAAAKVQHRERPLSLFVLDYIQIVTHSARGDRDYDRTTRAVRRLRELSRELNCPVIALSQLNRDAAGKNTEPGLHHLRESGAIEQDANNVLFLHRPDENQPDTKLIAAKWRGGDRGKFNLWLDGPSTRFVEDPVESRDLPNYAPEFAEYSSDASL